MTVTLQLPDDPSRLEDRQSRRLRVVQEDQLIHYRTSWSIWTQGILFALWGAVVKQSLDLAVTLRGTVQMVCDTPVERFYWESDAWTVLAGDCFCRSDALVRGSGALGDTQAVRTGTKRRHCSSASQFDRVTIHSFFGHSVATLGPLVFIVVWIYLKHHTHLFCTPV
jgi:hypothetical protein